MKSISTALLLLLTLISSATTYYVSDSGDDTNDGLTLATAFATLSQSSSVATSGDDVIVSGAHTITAAVNYVDGVDLTGSGATTVTVNISGDWQYGIGLSTIIDTTTVGNTVSNITFKGGGTQWGCLAWRGRNNIVIDNCIFNDFRGNVNQGFGDYTGLNTYPVNFVTGHVISNCTFNTCTELTLGGWHSGCINYGDTDGMEMFNNTFNFDKVNGQNGYAFKHGQNGYNKNTLIRNNFAYKPPSNNLTNNWNFIVELWFDLGGTVIRDNYFEGSVDANHVLNTTGTFGLDLRDNTLGYPSKYDGSDGANLNAAVYLEHDIEDVYIRRNLMLNQEAGVRFSPRDSLVKNINIHHNIAVIGNSDGDAQCTFMDWSSPSKFNSEDINVINNTILGTDADYGLNLQIDTLNGAEIVNNIFSGFDQCGVRLQGDQMDGVNIESNDVFNVATVHINNGTTLTNFTEINNIGVDPLLSSVYTPLASSPLLDEGKTTIYLTDYRRNPLNGQVDIGAIELQSAIANQVRFYLRIEN